MTFNMVMMWKVTLNLEHIEFLNFPLIDLLHKTLGIKICMQSIRPEIQTTF